MQIRTIGLDDDQARAGTVTITLAPICPPKTQIAVQDIGGNAGSGTITVAARITPAYRLRAITCAGSYHTVDNREKRKGMQQTARSTCPTDAADGAKRPSKAQKAMQQLLQSVESNLALAEKWSWKEVETKADRQLAGDDESSKNSPAVDELA